MIMFGDGETDSSTWYFGDSFILNFDQFLATEIYDFIIVLKHWPMLSIVCMLYGLLHLYSTFSTAYFSTMNFGSYLF